MDQSARVRESYPRAVNFEEIEFASDEYYRECELRDVELRQPLGLKLWTEDLAAERAQRHFGLFSEQRELLACVIAVPQTDSAVKIRQMAVASSQQGRGLGRSLIGQMETRLSREGVRHFWMHARLEAVGFYERLGYHRSGEVFTEVGIDHVRMEKSLTAPSQS